ncbi:hypothetical protein BS78_06G098100 [Paspalum vaginatum]|nr:hypothetical protein BS78_06G098100 [Paspalum vaginatum]
MFLKHQVLYIKRSGMEANYMIVRSLYDSSWRRMWLQRQRIRSDGKYSLSLISYSKVHYQKHIFSTTYLQIEMALLYPGHRYTLVRMRLRLRGTTMGANNRLDVLKILTTGVNATELKNWTGSILELVEGWEEDETHDPDVPAVSHSRGLSPFVFVPFEEVDTSVLNLPVEKMDYYVPG